MKGLVWLRSDLRIKENPALSMADTECNKIACIYLLSKKEWISHNNSNVKLDFIIRNLTHLSKDLIKLNIQLIITTVESYREIPLEIKNFCKSNNISKCYWNNEFGIDEQKRDKDVQLFLKSSGIEYQRFDDQIIFQPGTILTGQGKPFSVFTPFKKKWMENFSLDQLEFESKITLKEPFDSVKKLSRDFF